MLAGKRPGVQPLSPKSTRGPFVAHPVLLVLCLLLGTGCVAHRHAVGLGATGTGQQSARQYYIFFGLVATNDVDAQRMADGLTSYEIETRYGFFDLLLGPLLLPLTMTSRTVVVRT